MKIGFYTLGCKVNQYETQAMEQILTEMGHEVGDFSGLCDGYIINTCSVTAVADKKNRAVIRRCRRENPQAVIGVCGCYSQHDPEIMKQLGVDVVGGSAHREEFLQKMLCCPRQEAPLQMVDPAMKRREFEILPAGGLEGRTRAMLKVQDGCVNFCSYCIIPYTRGPVRSAPIALAIRQARELEDLGYREIVVTGIEIASWGVDLPGKPPLTELIREICLAVPALRIRLGSLEPTVVTEEFCSSLQGLSNLCPQFHLSMQSGCDTVLKRMHRKYDTAQYLHCVKLLRKAFPGCAVTTDMIVAFPGETQEEFEESLAFMKTCAFADMHIFPYSRRPGTPADKMPGQHSNDTKESRSRQAIALARELSENYRKEMLGKVYPVLFEETQGDFYVGHGPNYCKFYVKGQSLHNQIFSVRAENIMEDGVLGTII